MAANNLKMWQTVVPKRRINTKHSSNKLGKVLSRFTYVQKAVVSSLAWDAEYAKSYGVP